MKKKLDVLVIEDDTWFAEHHIRTLKKAGFSVRHAADGIEAIEQIDSRVPDAIVLDLFLPGPNAVVLLHEMQSYKDLANIPVVLCTSSDVGISPENLTSYGVVSVLDKATMQPSDLVAAIRRELL